MNKLSSPLRIPAQIARMLCGLCLLVPLSVIHAATQSPQTAPQITDPMLKAMQAELDREQAQLLLPGMQRPYFIEYRMEDIESYSAQASYGALTREQQQHQKVVRVTVRIGNYASDNSGSRGEGSVQLGPEDNDPVALRYALWTASDEAYKNALSAYSSKQAALKRFQSPPTADDFSPAKPVVEIGPLLKMEQKR